ncbi:MAG: hypothetical protein K1Y36_16895 [Blastocatellia bacterium]|nr:hypothetical protein [Blastocatellia bacterium]
MLFIDVFFSALLFFASFLWVGKSLRRAWLRRATLRDPRAEADDFWVVGDGASRRMTEDYAARHRRLYAGPDDDDSISDRSGWHVKSVSPAHRCEICHQSDMFDPETQECARCGPESEWIH